MRKIARIWLVVLVCIIGICSLAVSVSAADTPSAPPSGGPGDITEMLKNLSAKGYDVSKIQAAVASGDEDAIKKAMDDFSKANPDAMPKPELRQMTADELKKMVSDIKAKGGDVSAIEAALNGGDTAKAQSLLDEYMKANPDKMPTPPDGQQPPKQ